MSDNNGKLYPAVIFDLDGTLVDTIQDLADATNWGLSELNQPQHSVDLYRYMVGAGRTELCRAALPKDHQDLLEDLISLMTGYYEKHCFDASRPYPGIEDLLRRLANEEIRLTVLSNKPQYFVELTMKHLFDEFEFCQIIGDREDVPRKPDPFGALLIAERLGLKAESIAYVGDTSIDMQTARRAGMFGIGVSWGFREVKELLEAGAKKIVDTPEELYQVITARI